VSVTPHHVTNQFGTSFIRCFYYLDGKMTHGTAHSQSLKRKEGGFGPHHRRYKMTDDKTPDFIKGKRSIRITVRGSVNGYVGNKFSVAFGAQARAQEWIHDDLRS
jgi:hypothetical protein